MYHLINHIMNSELDIYEFFQHLIFGLKFFFHLKDHLKFPWNYQDYKPHFWHTFSLKFRLHQMDLNYAYKYRRYNYVRDYDLLQVVLPHVMFCHKLNRHRHTIWLFRQIILLIFFENFEDLLGRIHIRL